VQTGCAWCHGPGPSARNCWFCELDRGAGKNGRWWLLRLSLGKSEASDFRRFRYRIFGPQTITSTEHVNQRRRVNGPGLNPVKPDQLNGATMKRLVWGCLCILVIAVAVAIVTG
jgi:hypothetical protein